MKRTTFNKHIEAFINEALMLLRFQLALNRILKFDNLQNMSRSDFVDSLISLKAIENDLVIRICKFDDTSKGLHSFQNAISEMPLHYLNETEIKNKFEEFKLIILKIKKVRRHTQLAHLKIESKDNDFEIRYNLTPALKSIVNIIDLMKNSNVNYNWSDGQNEKYNLRKEVLKEFPEETPIKN